MSCCGARNFQVALCRSQNFDRCHASRSLFPPQAAVAFVPTSICLRIFAYILSQSHKKVKTNLKQGTGFSVPISLFSIAFPPLVEVKIFGKVAAVGGKEKMFALAGKDK